MTSAQEIIIGTRRSDLAIAQSHEIKKLILNKHPQYNNNPDLISIKGFQTTGDNILDKSLSDIGGKGLFTKEIEEALLKSEVSIAVHSMKDMPAIYPEGLDILATAKRENPHDAFISLKYKTIYDLPKNAIVGTSSTRRKAILLKLRPDLNIVNFRGNVITRLKKIENGEVDATILAVSGLKRIEKEKYISSILPAEDMLPAVGQGAIGIQCRIKDSYSTNIVSEINDFNTYACVKAERAFLSEIDGSCKTPIAGFCEIKNNQLCLKTMISKPDGTEIFETFGQASIEDAESLGKEAGLKTKKDAPHIVELFYK